MSERKTDKRSLAAAAFIQDVPRWRGGAYPTAKEFAGSFMEGCVLLWNRGAIFYGKQPEIVPAALLETDQCATARIMHLYHDYTERGYLAASAFPVDALRTVLRVQKQNANAVHKRRKKNGEFWKPFLITGQTCTWGYDPDMLMLCCTLLGGDQIQLHMPIDETNVSPIKLTSKFGTVFMLPVRM